MALLLLTGTFRLASNYCRPTIGRRPSSTLGGARVSPASLTAAASVEAQPWHLLETQLLPWHCVEWILNFKSYLYFKIISRGRVGWGVAGLRGDSQLWNISVRIKAWYYLSGWGASSGTMSDSFQGLCHFLNMSMLCVHFLMYRLCW